MTKSTHSLTVSDYLWAWAEKKGKEEGCGPAWILRDILMAKAMEQNGQHSMEHVVQEKQINDTARKEQVPILKEDYMMFITRPDERKKHWKEILKAFKDWKFSDPRGKMRMHPEQARDFCYDVLNKYETYEELEETGAHNVFWMLCDVYRRQHYQKEE
jgi:hypothetical protein